MDFHSELLNFQEEIVRLPKGVRADPAYWINRVKEKSSDGLLASFERQVKEEVKTGNGGAQFDADNEWIAFSRIMSKAIDIQKRRNVKSATEQQLTPYGLAAHGMRTGGRQQPGGRPPACDLCDVDSNARTKAMPTTHAMYLHSVYRSTAQRRSSMILR